jgi:hypothetical protein
LFVVAMTNNKLSLMKIMQSKKGEDRFLSEDDRQKKKSNRIE